MVDEESILGDDNVWSRHARVMVRNGHNFDPTVGSRSNSYWSFRMPFSTEWMRNGYSVIWRSGRAMLELRFEMTITFDPTFGSRSNSYWSFKDDLLHGVDEESILGDDEVWSRQA